MSLSRSVPLSVLDLAPVPMGTTTTEALRHSLELARTAERLGYRRHWVAEHHNMRGIAASAPAVLIGHLAQVTTTLRVGSGGVMLPNHPPLVVAEQFGMLEALHPGRIDLGIGRAPGTDPVTAAALRRSAEALGADDFPEQLGQLIGFFQGSFPDDHPYRRIHAVPGEGNMPSLWLLGSSGYSAQVAGLLGLPFAFAHHFSPENTVPAVGLYRRCFRPSSVLEDPYVMLGVNLVCAETDDRARWLHGPVKLQMLRRHTGRPGRMESPEEAASYDYSAGEERLAEALTTHHVVGAPTTVAAGLDELLERTGADELMAMTNLFHHDDRVRSYQLLAETAGLAAPAASGLRQQ